MEFAYNLYDVTLELNFSVILQEICDALQKRKKLFVISIPN